MKTVAIAVGTATLVVVLLIAGVWLGVTWMQTRWGVGTVGLVMMGGGDWTGTSCAGPSTGSGTMSRWSCDEAVVVPDDAGGPASLEDAEAAVERYLDGLNSTGLQVTEVMEFDRNFYAIVAEVDTGIGAMELLVDPRSGAVGPEPGPNMMWNAQYGMMGRGGMMNGSATDEMTLSPEEAEDLAQRWLDVNMPGRTAGEPDPFYGYYTLHFLNDGEIEGMLSVHGGTGDVWYHSWHGDFVAVLEGHGHD